MSNRRMDRNPARKIEALARNASWHALSAAEKIGRLAERPGFSRRQHARLAS